MDEFHSIPLFHGLNASALTVLQQIAREKKVSEGAFFFMQGDTADRIFALTVGRVRLSQSTMEGQQVLLRLIMPVTLFGVLALSEGEVYPVSAEALEDSLALTWIKADLMGVIKDSPQLALNALKIMSGHVQEFQERYLQLATERVERRLARSLLRLASQFGRKVEDGVLIDLPLTRQDLAEMNGTTLFTVSRTLSRWETQGLVLSGRERVVICFPHGLVRIAEDLNPD